MLAKGLHPAIAVVAANAVMRAAAVSALITTKGCRVVQSNHVEEELKRAAAEAVARHEAAVADHKSKVGEADRALSEAVDASLKASREMAAASGDLERFDKLAGRLSSAEDAYEAAVSHDAEAARDLAAALGELDRILGQRRSASTSLEQARKARDSRGVPEAVITQALNLQSALAKAEADKNEAVRQADEVCQASRTASREAFAALAAAHEALRQGISEISSAEPDWGAGVPLPGLVANHRDHLAEAVSASETSEAQAKSIERGARARLEQERHELDQLVEAGPPVLDPLQTAVAWLSGEGFSRDDAVIADDAFARFGPEGVANLLTTLSGRGSQVIYLTDDAEVLGWAIGLPHEAGGASTIAGVRERKPVLVND